MNLSRYDHLLEQRNARKDLPTPEAKCQQELLELGLALCHLDEGRNVLHQVAEECAHALLTIRGLILALDIEQQVQSELTAKALSLHAVILRRRESDRILAVQWGPM